jgi:hypothetical protein
LEEFTVSFHKALMAADVFLKELDALLDRVCVRKQLRGNIRIVRCFASPTKVGDCLAKCLNAPIKSSAPLEGITRC